MKLLHYLPYLVFFMLATMLLYGWGLWRMQRQTHDLMNALYAKGASRIRKAVRRKGCMQREELLDVIQGLSAGRPFSRVRIGVTDPDSFLDKLLAHMTTQRLLVEQKNGNETCYCAPSNSRAGK